MHSPVPVELDHPEPQPFLGRVVLLRLVTLALVLGFGARLWMLQVVRYPELERLASNNRVRLEPTEAPRGAIYDRKGRLLATNRLAHRVAILNLTGRQVKAAPARRPRGLGPSRLDAEAARRQAALPEPDIDQQLGLLASLLSLTDEELKRIRAELSDPARPQFTPVTVRDDVAADELIRVEERVWQLPSVVIETVPFRFYPEHDSTAHVIGYVGSISPTQLEREREVQDQELAQLEQQVALARRTYANERLAELERMVERLAILRRLRNQAARIVGKTGLEAAYEKELRGEPGIFTWQVNARNQPVQLVSTTRGLAGNALHLNLDRDLQQAAAKQLAGRRGSAVAIDPRNGAVLCMVSSPSYDPNLFIPRIKPDAWRAILGDPAHPMQNRAIRNNYPPGSTFKGMVSTVAGLESGAITGRSGASCGGGMRIGSRFKRCWTVHGYVDLTRAIAVSCDTFFYQAALRMGPQSIIDTAREFGLGETTGVDLGGETTGRLPDVEAHKRRWKRDWYPGDTANIVIGQGDVQTTTLQMALVTATVANRGTVWRPQVVREVRSRDGKQVVRPWRPERSHTVHASPEHFDAVRRGMRAAVTSGTSTITNLPHVQVAGKTGSAEDPPRVLPHAWFVCFAPYDNPTIAICTMVENAGHGSTNAGPIARAMLDAYFGEAKGEGEAE